MKEDFVEKDQGSEDKEELVKDYDVSHEGAGHYKASCSCLLERIVVCDRLILKRSL